MRISELPSATLGNSALVTETVSQIQKAISDSNSATEISSTSMPTTPSIGVEPASTIESSMVWTKVLSEPQKTISISSADAIIGSTSVLVNSYTGIQRSVTVKSIFTSTVGIYKTSKVVPEPQKTISVSSAGTIIGSTSASGNSYTGVHPSVTVTSIFTPSGGIYKTLLSESFVATSLKRLSENSTTTNISPEISKTTPFVGGTSYLTSLTRPSTPSVVEPASTIESSMVWTKVVSEPQKTILNYTSDTITGSTLVLLHSYTAIQRSVTVTSILTSTVGIYKTSLSESFVVTSLKRALENSTTSTSSSPETSKSTPLVGGTSHLTSRPSWSNNKTVAPSQRVTERVARSTTIKGRSDTLRFDIKACHCRLCSRFWML